MTKDFSGVSAQRVYNTIEEATKETKPERKTYSEEEAVKFMQECKTAGRKGVKMPRINLAFTPDNYEYIKTMAQVRGESLTEFVNYILRQSMTDNMEVYEKAREFKQSL